LDKFPFRVEFIWQPVSPADREQRKKDRQAAEAAQAPAAAPTPNPKS
jgi:hypothetical protein